MAMAEYRGVNGVARKIVKEYRGVNGVARQIAKAYRGVNGIARQYFDAVTKLYLYISGDLCESLTGGWSTKYGNNVYSASQTGWSGKPTRTQEPDHLLIYMKDLSYNSSSNYNYIGSWHTTNPINMDDWRWVNVVLDIELGDAYASKTSTDPVDRVRVSVSSSTYINDAVKSASIPFENWAANGKNEIAVNVSDLSGDYYIIVDARRNKGNLTSGDESITLKIKEVYLE